jgi:hypothetical protein
MYGFGARVNGAVRHLFPLSFDDHNPDVTGVSGMLEAYEYGSFAAVRLSCRRRRATSPPL